MGGAAGRIQGQLDVPLSARGVWQAARLAQRLAAEPIDAVVSSNLSRARLTAEPLAQAVHSMPTARPPELKVLTGQRLQVVAPAVAAP